MVTKDTGKYNAIKTQNNAIQQSIQYNKIQYNKNDYA
jgi:hypothetical protein